MTQIKYYIYSKCTYFIFRNFYVVLRASFLFVGILYYAIHLQSLCFLQQNTRKTKNFQIGTGKTLPHSFSMESLMETPHLGLSPHRHRSTVAERFRNVFALHFQGCTLEAKQVFYFLQHREQQIRHCFSKQSAVCLTDMDLIKCSIYWLSINSISYFTPVTFFGSQSHIPIEQAPQKYLCIKKEKKSNRPSTSPFQLH